MSIPLFLISRTIPRPWPSSFSVDLWWTPPRPPVSVFEAANLSHGSLLHRGFSAFSAGHRRRPCFPPSSVWVSLNLSFCLCLCVWLCIMCVSLYTCVYGCMSQWYKPTYEIRTWFEFVLIVDRIHWRFKGRPMGWSEDPYGFVSEDQMTIWTQNRIISCKCTRSPSLWLFYFIEIIFELLILDTVFIIIGIASKSR